MVKHRSLALLLGGLLGGCAVVGPDYRVPDAAMRRRMETYFDSLA